MGTIQIRPRSAAGARDGTNMYRRAIFKASARRLARGAEKLSKVLVKTSEERFASRSRGHRTMLHLTRSLGFSIRVLRAVVQSVTNRTDAANVMTKTYKISAALREPRNIPRRHAAEFRTRHFP